jgi:hypothetical protein
MQFKHLSQSARRSHIEASYHDVIENLDRLHASAKGMHSHERIAGFLNMQCAGLRYDMGQMAAQWAAEHGHHTPEAVARFMAERTALVPMPTVFAKKATFDENESNRA